MMLAGLLMLQGVVSLVQGEVVSSFKTVCPAVFIKDQNNVAIPPSVGSGKQYKQICQIYSNLYRYATLYDTELRIPVYSAYIYGGYNKTTRKNSWMIEPQLDGYNETQMTPEAGWKVGANQAVNKDYTDNYQKGHLYPCCQNCQQDQCESTFTLTNAAPQTGPDNKQWYWRVERELVKDIERKCNQKKAYVITGVIRGIKMLNNRVNIPSYYWSAFCCADKEASQGYVMEMRGDGKGVSGNMTVAELNSILSKNIFTFKAFGTLNGCS